MFVIWTSIISFYMDQGNNSQVHSNILFISIKTNIIISDKTEETNMVVKLLHHQVLLYSSKPSKSPTNDNNEVINKDKETSDRTKAPKAAQKVKRRITPHTWHLHLQQQIILRTVNLNF